jgi:lipoprotein-anchoring transpeptidase ErfK/SrfK
MRIAAIVAPLFLFAACSPPAGEQEPPVVQMSADARSEMDRINSARFTRPMAPTLEDSELVRPQAAAEPAEAAPPPAGETPSEATPLETVQYDAGLVRIQTLLDRAHISRGVFVGFVGVMVRKAVSEYQRQHGIAVTGVADDAFLTRLEQADASPALVAYVITEEDVAGPFADVPSGLEAMAELDALPYGSAAEALAEKFHMDVDLLRLLNPDVDFAQAGAEIVVANAGGELDAEVASIEVDKQTLAVRAYDAGGQLLAFYPASIGSSDAPAPSGDYAVRAVAFNPTYHYNSERLPTFGQRDHGALTIAAGPNGPVGSVWIALTLDTYGIHGTAAPAQISKTQSHGCVRLTNWDATELGRAVQQGVPVSFVESASAQAQPSSRPG